MPKSIVRVSPPLLEQFLENLPDTGVVVTGLSPAYLYSDDTLRVSIAGDDVPDAPETVVIFTRTHAYMRPTMTLRPYVPVQRPDTDGLLPYQRDALKALEGEGKVFFPARSHSKSWFQRLFPPCGLSFSQRLRAVREKAEAEIRKFDEQSAQRNNVSKNGQQVSDEDKQ
ncbi:hypothetical protein OIV19_21625 [Brucella sp. HL-2]|nr:hypothetical protein [Brucella sp. HL-2]MCV9910198.1 hypothetical protein [Brucella sp. HL-2]